LFSVASPIPLENIRAPAQWAGATAFAEKYGAGLNYTGYAQGLHPAIDLAAIGGTSVLAMAYGKVIAIGSSGANTYIDILSGDFVHRYQHLQELQVAPGDNVQVGQAVGAVHSDAGHLHFEIRNAAQTILYNPVLFLPGDYTQQLAVIARGIARAKEPGDPYYEYIAYQGGVTYNNRYLDPFNLIAIGRGPGNFHPPRTMYLNTFPYVVGW
jgi:hypothetical protein